MGCSGHPLRNCCCRLSFQAFAVIEDRQLARKMRECPPHRFDALYDVVNDRESKVVGHHRHEPFEGAHRFQGEKPHATGKVIIGLGEPKFSGQPRLADPTGSKNRYQGRCCEVRHQRSQFCVSTNERTSIGRQE